MRRFDFDPGLAPYNLAAHTQWRVLSALLTPAVLARLAPAQVRSQRYVEEGACRGCGACLRSAAFWSAGGTVA